MTSDASIAVPFWVTRPKVPDLTSKEALGRRIFFDARLSNPPGTSCASCHDPANAFSGNHGSTRGVAQGSRPGHFSRRNTPSVLYLKYVPAFHYALEDDDDVVPSPFGGLAWDGRADSVAEFSRLPLFDPNEMNGGSASEVASKLRNGPYANDVEHEFPGALERPADAVAAVGAALQAFLTSGVMAPFTSKYDDSLRGIAKLTAQEARGLKLFKDRSKGACGSCHRLFDNSNRPESSLFTNYGYDAVAVPRNRTAPESRDPSRYDLGLCERTNRDPPSSDKVYCAQFRTPSLRNVAVRERFMHNGAFSSLRDVVSFYSTRTTTPGRWYPPGAKYDDVPLKYRGNVNVTSLPYNRIEGSEPVLADDEIDAVVAFLQTLTDEAYR